MGTNVNAEAHTRAVLDGVRHIVQALRESSRLAERHVGLSGAQLFVLQQLAEVKSASVGELARRTHTHQSSVSVVVTRLVEQGLVRRTRSGTDARSVVLSLSVAGRKLVLRGPDVAQERLVRAIKALPLPRRRALALALKELASAIDRTDRVPAMFFEEDERGPRRRRTNV